MKTCTATLKSISPYSQSGFFQTQKDKKEGHDAFEKRAWRERLHVNDRGMVFIPPMAFKNCLDEAARRASIKIPGQGSAKYTKHFEAGVLVMEGPELPLKPEEVEGEWLWMNADGKRGGGTRVQRCYPRVREWEADVVYHVLDDKITEEVFEQVLRESGSFVGIGRFRPQNRGYYGRFEVKKLVWS